MRVVLSLLVVCCFLSEAHPERRSVSAFFGLTDRFFLPGSRAQTRAFHNGPHEFSLFKNIHEQYIQASFPNNTELQWGHLERSLEIQSYLEEVMPADPPDKTMKLGYLPSQKEDVGEEEEKILTSAPFYGIGYAEPSVPFIDKIVPIEHAVTRCFFSALFQWEGFDKDLYYVRVPAGTETQEAMVSFGSGRSDFCFSHTVMRENIFHPFGMELRIMGNITTLLFSNGGSHYEIHPLLKVRGFFPRGMDFSGVLFQELLRKGFIDKYALNTLSEFFV